MDTPQTRAKVDTAWRARVAGSTWRQTAELAGYSDEHAVMKAVRVTYGTLPRFEREDLRNLWRDRLETMWQQVQKDMAEQRPGAVTAAVRVAGAAIMLDGLAEPTTRVDMSVSETFLAITAELVSHDLLPSDVP